MPMMTRPSAHSGSNTSCHGCNLFMAAHSHLPRPATPADSSSVAVGDTSRSSRTDGVQTIPIARPPMSATAIVSLACHAGSAESTKPWPNAGSSGTANAGPDPRTRAITPARAGPLHAAIAIAAKSAETMMNRAAKRMLAVEARPARKMPSQPASSDPTTGGGARMPFPLRSLRCA